jgi:hypothetical protein
MVAEGAIVARTELGSGIRSHRTWTINGVIAMRTHRCFRWTSAPTESVLRLRWVCLGLWLLAGSPAAAQKDLTVKLPSAGEYLVWLEAHTGSGTQAQAPVRVTTEKAALTLPAAPAGLSEWLVLALDEKSGYVAAKSLPAKDTPASLSLSTRDFNRVHRVRVQVTGAGDKPLANASVTLTDTSGVSLSRVIDPTAAGSAEFMDVPSGHAKLAVTTGAGKSTTKDVDINLAKGETIQTITVPLPEITAVVEPPPAATTGTSAAPGTTAGESGKTTGGDTSKLEDSKTTGETAETPAGAPAPAPPAPSGGGGLGTLIGLILVLGLCYWAFLHLKNQGWTVDKALTRLGVQPDAAPVAAGAVSSPVPPAPAVDPSVCAFCGQRKDPVTGACACSLDAGAAGPAVASAPAAGGSGPRLVAVGGVAMGQIFPIAGETTIGRDATNGVPLAMDTTVSRRHAVIAADGGGYIIRDQGSSNGTFVNGQRVEETALRPGDEVSIGGTRFRFEA